MIETAIEFSRYFIALLFGTVLAVSFAGMAPTRKNYLMVSCFTSGLFIVQFICLMTWGMELTIKIYPLLSHLPVVIFILLYLKRSWLISLTSMFTSFLCCQFPRWIGSVTGAISDSLSMNHLGYILAVFLMYYVLQKYVVNSVRHLMERSAKSCLLFGAMPAFYYLFDYTAFVYTDFMYSGTRAALQFMPFLTSAFYFVSKRYIKLRMYTKNNKLCIDIRNSYQTEPIFYQGLPLSKEEGHGIGTKSMAHIVEKHGGVFKFSAQDGWFIFQATT